MEEEAVGCDALLAKGEVLGVPSASIDRARHSAHAPWQGSPSRLQGQAGILINGSLLGSSIDFHLLLKIDEFMASDLVLFDTNLVCECLVKLHIDVIVSR